MAGSFERASRRPTVKPALPLTTRHAATWGKRVFRGEIVRRIRVAHDRGETEGRDVDAFDVIRLGVERSRRLPRAHRVQRRSDCSRPAGASQLRVISQRLPSSSSSRPGRSRRPRGWPSASSIASSCASKPASARSGASRARKAAHAAGHVQRRRAGNGVGVARRQAPAWRQCALRGWCRRRSDPQSRSRRGGAQQRSLTVLVCASGRSSSPRARRAPAS